MDLRTLGAVFDAFADHLRARPPTRSVTITSTTYDPTFGAREDTQDVEIVDMDRLIEEIESFSAKLRAGEVEL